MHAELPERIRVAVCQWGFDRVAGWDAFAAKVARQVRIAADYRADFLLLPELLTFELLSAEPTPLPGNAAIEALSARTPQWHALLSQLAASHRVNIIGGSHVTRTDAGSIRNVCYVALRDGTLHAREKLHVTPNERDAWQVSGGVAADVIETDCGPVGIMVCYDSEFPELGRHLVDQGAMLLLVPASTDDRNGWLRVRHCCQARAIENQVYVAVAGNVGELKGVWNLDVQQARSAVLTPCDFGFAREGIAVEAPDGVATLVVAELDPGALLRARALGTVRNLADRRADLYRVAWREDS
jgi:predicted amidohydrolase